MLGFGFGCTFGLGGFEGGVVVGVLAAGARLFVSPDDAGCAFLWLAAAAPMMAINKNNARIAVRIGCRRNQFWVLGFGG
jgi:hypothetical protein